MNLVTGAGGMLGGNLLFELINRGEEVRALIRSEKSIEKVRYIFGFYTSNPEVYIRKIDWRLGDILDNSVLHEIFSDIKSVYHCAAIVSLGKKKARQMLDINIRGTANVVNQCLAANVEKLVHVSSIAAINSKANEELTTEEEKWPTDISLDYTYSKTQSEFEVMRGLAEGLNAVIVNPSVILGVGDITSGSGAIFGRIQSGLKYFTHGITGFIDVRDVVKAMIFLMKSDISAERYILNSENLSYETLFSFIAKSLKVKAPQKYATPFLTEMAWRIDRIKSFLLFSEPQITKKTARVGHKKSLYSAEKYKQLNDVEFIPISRSIEEIGDYYFRSEKGEELKVKS